MKDKGAEGESTEQIAAGPYGSFNDNYVKTSDCNEKFRHAWKVGHKAKRSNKRLKMMESLKKLRLFG